MKGFFASSDVLTDKPTVGLIPKCGACGLFKTCRSPKMVPYGQGGKRVLVIGEAPGQNEDEQGRPFVGKAGQLLRDILGSVGVRLDRDATTTNAIICRPPKNKTPDSNQISWCRPNLLNTIKEVEPRVIVTLGRVPLESLIELHWKGKVSTMERWAGWQIPLKDYWVCPTWHPSYLARLQKQDPRRYQLVNRLFADHLETAFELKEKPSYETKEDLEKQVEILYDGVEIQRALEDIDSRKRIAGVDFETNCLKPEYPKSELVSCAVSDGIRTIAYPMGERAKKATRAFLLSKNTKKVSANLKMEDRWARVKLGVVINRWRWDTVIGAHVLDNRAEICSLKFQAFVLLGIETYNENVEPFLQSVANSRYNRIHQISMDTLLLYNGLDALLQRKVSIKQMKLMGYGV